MAKKAKTKEVKTLWATASGARREYNNGNIKDRQIFKLKYPGDKNLVGYCAFVRGEMFTRQRELPEKHSEEERVAVEQIVREDLEKFLTTINASEDE